MAEYNPTRIRRIGTGNTGRVRSMVPGTDTINPAVMPTAYPNVWAEGVTYTRGQQVFLGEFIYLCRADHVSSSANRPTVGVTDNNWTAVTGGVQRLAADNGANTLDRGRAWRSIDFEVDQSSSYTSPSFQLGTDTTGGIDDGASITLRIPEYVTAASAGGVNAAGNGLNIESGTVVIDYNDPETLIRLISQSQSKTLTFANGLPSTAAVQLQPETGSTAVDYFVNYTFTDGLPSRIDYYEGTDTTGTLRAVKRLTFANGLPQSITIGAS